MKGKKKCSIRRKLTTLLLAMVLFTLFLIGSVSIYSIYTMKHISVDSSRTLGQTAADDAEEALEALAVSNLQNTAIEKAAYIEEKFAAVESSIHGIVSQAQDIYAHPERYPDRSVALPMQGVQELSAQLLWSERLDEQEARTNAASELLKLGNIQDLLLQYNAHNDMISSAYIATESGWMIQADYIAFSKYEGGEQLSYEAAKRQWYQLAREAGPGEVVYTDVMWDIHEGGDCIVCASPVFYQDELVAVAGIGFYLEMIKNTVLDTTIGEEGYAFLINEKGQILASGQNTGEIAAYLEQEIDLRECSNSLLAETAGSMTEGWTNVRKLCIDGKEVYLAYAPLNRLGWSFAAVMEVEEIIAPAKESQNMILALTDTVAAELDGTIKQMQVLSGALLTAITLLVCLSGTVFSKMLTEPIRTLTEEVAKIDGGNLDYRIHINTGDEVEDLSNAFQKMTAQIQSYVKNLANVTAEKERIRTEIQVAASVQADMLPKVEGIYADRREFTLAASMTPAKGVGGDFYDFFLLDEGHLGFVMADVSGKGVPAALFMVVSRTLIRSHIAIGLPLEQAVMEINESLCANNKNGMFVTAWIGVLSLSTGELTFVNAGHCRPVIRGADGTCAFDTTLGGFVLAGMEGVPYRQSNIQLKEGDTLLLYTDGVTEATSVEKQLYGEARLKAVVENTDWSSPKKLLEMLWESVDDFQKGGEQFDDITMLALTYHGDGFSKITGEPDIGQMRKYTVFVEEHLKKHDISAKAIGKIQVAIDEIFSNICYYSKATECTLGIRIEQPCQTGGQNAVKKIIFYLEDNGLLFNPLERPDPDVKEPLEQRQTGGLGIYIVKKQMDFVEYKLLQGKNRLTCYIEEK